MSASPTRRVSAATGRTARVEKVSGVSSSRAAAKGEDASAWLAAWTSALDDLELDITQAEALLNMPSEDAAEPAPVQADASSVRDARFAPASRALPAPRTDTARTDTVTLSSAAGAPALDAAPAPGPWTPPEIGGPLPVELKDRAVALLDRQLAAAEALAKSMLGNRQHSGLIERMERSGDEPRSAYVDRAC